MTVARVVFLARYRVPHACMAMQFDHNLLDINRTVISSPVPKEELWPVFEKYGIDTSQFDYLPDSEILSRYPEIENWVFEGDYRGPWLRQQALKLSVLDYLPDDVVLMHDSDTFMTEPWSCYHNNQLDMLILPNTTHGSYDKVMTSVLGIPRQTPHCFVTELVPTLKQDWVKLRTTLEERHSRHFLDAIIDNVPGMPTIPPWGNGNLIKWFSEYEFLGNWTLSQRKIQFTEQRRFEYDSLDKLVNFTKNYNCFADAVPDLRLSLQLNWDTMEIANFDHYMNIIKTQLA